MLKERKPVNRAWQTTVCHGFDSNSWIMSRFSRFDNFKKVVKSSRFQDL